MEFSIRRKRKDITQQLNYNKQKQNNPIQQHKESNTSTQCNISLFNNDLCMSQILLNTLNENIKAKASMLLSLPISPRVSVQTKKDYLNRDSKLSFINNSKKKIIFSQINQIFANKKSIKDKLNKFQIRKTDRTQNKSLHSDKQNKQQKIDNQNLYKLNHFSIARRNPINIYSVPDYFQLVFSKILSKPGKQKIYTLIEQLSKHYVKFPQIINQDVIDIQTISPKLRQALGPKQTYVQLRPFEALQVNGQLARLIFHLCHQVTARKYKDYDLIKIYKQIEYCSRKLQAHNFTLKVCFEIGQIYKQRNDEINSHAYFAKALKMAIYLNDKFHQQKAIDCFGITAFSSSKSGQAYYFHQNSSKLNFHQRELIKQKYSNSDQIQKISRGRQLPFSQKSKSIKKIQTFNFTGRQFIPDFDAHNKKIFKNNINKYIQCPIMRQNILIARDHMNKIANIGHIEKYKKFQTYRTPRFNQDIQSSSQVLLTHRSLNRKNPQSENRTVQRQRKILLQLINYYTNEHMFHK